MYKFMMITIVVQGSLEMFKLYGLVIYIYTQYYTMNNVWNEWKTVMGYEMTNRITDEFGMNSGQLVKWRVSCFCVYFTELRQFLVNLGWPVKQCYV